jgi:hypothetical protein
MTVFPSVFCVSRKQNIISILVISRSAATKQSSIPITEYYKKRAPQFPVLPAEASYEGGKVINKKRVQLLAEPLIKVGDDLLSHNRSTIGAGRLNFSVRNGKRWSPVAIVT